MFTQGSEVYVLSYRQYGIIMDICGDEYLVGLRNGNCVWIEKGDLA